VELAIGQRFALAGWAGHGKLPLSMRETDLDRLLAGRPDGIFVAPFERGEIGAELFRAACNVALKVWFRSAATGLIRLDGRSIGSKSRTECIRR
jgi:hypothetical protein